MVLRHSNGSVPVLLTPASTQAHTFAHGLQVSEDGEALVLRFSLTNTHHRAVQIGALGFALPEHEGHPPAGNARPRPNPGTRPHPRSSPSSSSSGITSVVWNDPHIGAGHGFVEFVRVVNDQVSE